MQKEEKVILSTLYLLKKVWGRTYLQKFLYLLNREVFEDQLLHYKFYKYGPFSSQINDCLKNLEEQGLVKEDTEKTKGLNTAYTFELTEKGKEVASNVFHSELTVDERDKLLNYTTDFKHHSPTELLLYVYKKYPEVAENSVFGLEEQ